MIGKKKRGCAPCSATTGCRPIYIVLVLFLLWLPFIVCDLYFAYTDYYCTEQFIMNTKIIFTMAVWLQVRAYTSLGFIIILLVLAIIDIVRRTARWPRLAFSIFLIIALLFQLAWLIVGAIMFWGYLWPASICIDSVNNYLWASLILMFLIWIVGIALAMMLCRGKRQSAFVSRDVDLTGVDTWTGPPIQYPTSQIPTSQNIHYPTLSQMPSRLNYDLPVQGPSGIQLQTPITQSRTRYVEYNTVKVNNDIVPVPFTNNVTNI